MTHQVGGGGARALSWPIFGLSLLSLIGSLGAAGEAGAAGALPAGGQVVAGSATIGAPTGSKLVIDQSSSRAIIDWSSFSIGSGKLVKIDNGSGATLNRVTGGSLSSIDGLLSATGSVYLINPNGVIIGKSGVAKVGGTFVAASLDVANGQFMSGGDLTFAGPSTAAVVNFGKIGALGGDVALVAARVDNQGSISAPNGDAGLLAGYQVVLRDSTLSDGKFAVLLGGGSTSATNAGVIEAAEAELRANDGNVYALAGNTGGVIKATGVSASNGKVFLVAGGGAVSLAGDIEARGTNGAGGAIETSGSTVNIGAARIDAGAGGSWLLDPDDLTIDQTAANTIAASLDAGTSVTQQTTASGIGGNGDIFVSTGVTLDWTTSAALTLSAFRNISLGASSTIASSGGGAVTLYADNTGAGVGTVSFSAGAVVSTSGAVTIFYNPPSNPAGSVVNPTSYTTTTDFTALVSGGATLTAFMLVNTVEDLQNIQNNLAGAYALGADIDATATSTWNAGAGFVPLGGPVSAFTGDFEGQGRVISGLTVNLPAVSDVGLFGEIGPTGKIGDVGVVGGSITGDSEVGGLVGFDDLGKIVHSYATDAVVGSGNALGGLVGDDQAGTMKQDYASGAVTGGGSSQSVGGLVGVDEDGGKIKQAYATGAVSGFSSVGGLIGAWTGNGFVGQVKQTYATGAVSGAGTSVGGLIGANSGATLLASYWDTQTSGQASSAGGVGLTTAQFFTTSSFVGFNFQTAPGAGGWVIVDGDGSLNSAGGFAGATRPMLMAEYSTTIENGHQLQLMALDLTANYTLASDVDLTATANSSDVWNPATGFAPIGGNAMLGYTGVFDGAGHTISNLTIHFLTPVPQTFTDGGTSDGDAGLFGLVGIGGVVEDTNLVGAKVKAGDGMLAGALAGVLGGTVSNSTSSGKVKAKSATGTQSAIAGGLVGASGTNAVITGSSSSAKVIAGNGALAGGLLGFGDSGTSVVSSSASGSVTVGESLSTIQIAEAGGLVGTIDGLLPTTSPAPTSITGSNGSGAVTGGGGSIIGGFAGIVTDANVGGSFATGTVTQTAGGMNGENSIAGGFVGYMGANGVISRSFSSGAVSTQGGPNNGLFTLAGGFVGDMDKNSTIGDAYETGSLTSTGSFNLLGGFAGLLMSTADFTRVYAAGPVSGSGAVGGLVGDLSGGSFTDSYWDEGTTGLTEGNDCCGGGSSSGIVGIGGTTGLDPTAQSTYTFFDFTAVWSAPAAGQRPTLQGVGPP